MDGKDDAVVHAQKLLRAGRLKMALRTSTKLEHDTLIECGYVCLQALRLGSAIRIFDALGHRQGLLACRTTCIAHGLKKPIRYISHMLGMPHGL